MIISFIFHFLESAIDRRRCAPICQPRVTSHRNRATQCRRRLLHS
ncbi:MAG TPA: hypothetical protein V6D02_15455 [Candidatus Obscuribacterales bacterium]